MSKCNWFRHGSRANQHLNRYLASGNPFDGLSSTHSCLRRGVPGRPCRECARIWLAANRFQDLPLLPILATSSPPDGRVDARVHLLHSHHLTEQALVGIGSVWACGIFAGSCFSPGVSGSTFSQRVFQETLYRKRLYAETCSNMRDLVNGLRSRGALAEQDIVKAASLMRRAGGPTKLQLDIAWGSSQELTALAFEIALRTVEPG